MTRKRRAEVDLFELETKVVRFASVVQVSPRFVDFNEYTAADAFVAPIALLPIGRVTEYEGSLRLSHQIAKRTPASTEMSGNTWCPVASASMIFGVVAAPVAPLYRKK